MNTFTYHRDIRCVLAALGNIFGGIILQRSVSDTENPVFDEIAVPVMYSPKSRVLHGIVNTSNHIKLPVMCYQLKGMSYDTTRTFNKIDGYVTPNGIDWTNSRHPQPLPVKMQIQTSFISRFQEDCDQYCTCLFTNFYPYVIISYKHPDLNVEVRCKVIWDGNITMNYPDQFAATDSYRLEIDAGFTVETWFFKNDEKKANIIYNIPIDFTALNEFSSSLKWMEDQKEIPDNTDARVRRGRPIARYTSTTVVDVDNSDTYITLKGEMFETLKHVAIVDMDESTKMYDYDSYKTYTDILNYIYNDKGEIERKDVVNFVGVPAEFEVLSDSMVKIKFPVAKRGGRFDIYLVGKYGLGKLSLDSRRAYRDADRQLPTTNGILGVKTIGTDEE